MKGKQKAIILLNCHAEFMGVSYAHHSCAYGTFMQPTYDKAAPKKATNLSINSSLLSQARSLGINLSATLEQALEEEIRKTTRQKWLEDNKRALENCNTLAEEHGLFADKHRPF